MGYGDYLRQLLKPLGVYDLTPSSFSGGELEALGAALDSLWAVQQTRQRESLLMTAEDEGLDRWAALFRDPPAAPTPALRRAALAALLRVADDSFTVAALSDCLSGCGVTAQVVETDTPGVVQVRFPDTMGEPAEYDRIRAVIADILPCHLLVEYALKYQTWGGLLDRSFRWQDGEALSWYELACLED